MSEIHDRFEPKSQRDWDMVRAALLERSNWLCEYCDKPIAWKGSEIDHMEPRARGGSDHYVNLAITCRYCNRAKRDKGRDEFEDWLYAQ